MIVDSVCAFVNYRALQFTTKFSPIVIGLNWSLDKIVFIRGESLSAHSACPRKIPGWIVVVRENFSVNKRSYRKYTTEIVLSWVFRFLFQILHLNLTAFIKKKFENSIWFLNWRAEENVVVKNNGNRVCLCLGTISLIVSSWKFDVLKTSIFALEASLLGQIFVLRTSNSAWQLLDRLFHNRNTLLFK